MVILYSLRRCSEKRELRSRVWQMRHILSAYDAAYLALAEALDAPPITRDCALARTRQLGAG